MGTGGDRRVELVIVGNVKNAIELLTNLLDLQSNLLPMGEGLSSSYVKKGIIMSSSNSLKSDKQQGKGTGSLD